MDLNKAQGRQAMPAVPESREHVAGSEIRSNPTDIQNIQGDPEKTRVLYTWLNITIRCAIFEQHRAYLKCPLCSEYAKCAQLRAEQRIQLETSPFFSIKEITWEGPRRIKNMYIAVCIDGTLRRLDNFDPKDTNGLDIDQYKDVEEVLVVTKAFRRKVMWAPVPLEQVDTSRDNGRTKEEPEKLIDKDGIAALPRQQQARKGAAKPKNGKQNNIISKTGEI